VRRDASLEETVDFLKREAGHFGNKAEDKSRSEEVRTEEDEALGAIIVQWVKEQYISECLVLTYLAPILTEIGGEK
jgi:hypothetical protein